MRALCALGLVLVSACGLDSGERSEATHYPGHVDDLGAQLDALSAHLDRLAGAGDPDWGAVAEAAAAGLAAIDIDTVRPRGFPWRVGAATDGGWSVVAVDDNGWDLIAASKGGRSLFSVDHNEWDLVAVDHNEWDLVAVDGNEFDRVAVDNHDYDLAGVDGASASLESRVLDRLGDGNATPAAALLGLVPGQLGGILDVDNNEWDLVAGTGKHGAVVTVRGAVTARAAIADSGDAVRVDDNNWDLVTLDGDRGSAVAVDGNGWDYVAVDNQDYDLVAARF